MAKANANHKTAEIWSVALFRYPRGFKGSCVLHLNVGAAAALIERLLSEKKIFPTKENEEESYYERHINSSTVLLLNFAVGSSLGDLSAFITSSTRLEGFLITWKYGESNHEFGRNFVKESRDWKTNKCSITRVLGEFSSLR